MRSGESRVLRVRIRGSGRCPTGGQRVQHQATAALAAEAKKAGMLLMRDPFGTMTSEAMGACPVLKLNVTRSVGCDPISDDGGSLGSGE